MAFWKRVKDTFKKPAPPAEMAPAPPPTEESYLRALLGDPARAQEVGEESFWNAWNMLLRTQERSAIELLTRFIQTYPTRLDLQARLAELLCDRMEFARAEPLLEKLTSSPPHRLRAHFLLGEAKQRAGQKAAARRHFESILSEDLDYPFARARADALKPPSEKEAPTTAVAAPTLAGLGAEGTEMLGRYRLMRELGRGGAGTVYLAHDQELDRPLALKILHRNPRVQAEMRLRAWNEARLAAALRHPGIVAIYDLDEERHLMAMEYCAGGTLLQRIGQKPLSFGVAVGRMKELLSVLALLHQRGIVHGDCKPANLLHRSEAADSELVLSDFGLARLDGGGSEVPGGTLAYMAPEQFRGQLGSAVDVYAAAIIFLECLGGSGALDWLGPLDDAIAFVRTRRNEPSKWSGTLPDSVPPSRQHEVRALVDKMLSIDSADRPTASEALAAVANWPTSD